MRTPVFGPVFAVLLAACSPQGASPVTPHPPLSVCPPDPPAGSGFVCAPKPPPAICTTIPKEILSLDDGTIAGWVLPINWRTGIRNFVHGVQDVCGVPESVRLRRIKP